MQPPLVAAFYVGLNALILVGLAALVVRTRGRVGVALGDGGAPALTQAIRAHGNAAETIPLCAVLLVLVETLGAPGWVTHGLGLMLTAGRGVHAFHMIAAPGNLGLRAVGMALTLTAILLSALGLVGHALARGL